MRRTLGLILIGMLLMGPQSAWALANPASVFCAKSGGKQRAKRITRSDVDFINGELAWWDPYDPQCQEVGTDEFWCWY